MPEAEPFLFRGRGNGLPLNSCSRVDVNDYRLWTTFSGFNADSGGSPSQEQIDDSLAVAAFFTWNLYQLGTYNFGSDYPDLTEPVLTQPPVDRVCGVNRLRFDNRDNGQFFNNGWTHANIRAAALYDGETFLGWGALGRDGGVVDVNGIEVFMGMSAYSGSGFYSQIYTGGYTNNTTFGPDNTLGSNKEGYLKIPTPVGDCYLVSTAYTQDENEDITASITLTEGEVSTSSEFSGISVDLQINPATFEFYTYP